MHITIYGVGRSGTKAVQLYLAYLIALKEERVWINYEPYFWLDRKTQTINYEGFFIHKNSPHIISSEKDLSSKHKHFLKKLEQKNVSVISKFIRANGRINAINQLLKPDHSFLIVRDLYEVLNSVLRMEWDFWSVGWEFRIDWDAFVEEVKSSNLIDRFDWCIQNINDRIDKNAFYWYAMNKIAILLASSDLTIIRYSNLLYFDSIAKTIFTPDLVMDSIISAKFDGELLHYNYPLESFEKFSAGKNLINHFAFKTKLTHHINRVFESTIGSIATTNKDYYIEKTDRKKATKISIEKKELYEFFIEDVNQELNKVTGKVF